MPVIARNMYYVLSTARRSYNFNCTHYHRTRLSTMPAIYHSLHLDYCTIKKTNELSSFSSPSD